MGNKNEVIKCMYEGELFAYLPKWAIEDEYDLPDDKLSEVMSSNKGDVVHALDDTFENIGSIEEILKENADINESRLRIWRKLTQRNYENGKLCLELKTQKKQNEELLRRIEEQTSAIIQLKSKLATLSSALHGVLVFTEDSDFDDDGTITLSSTGEVISE